MLLRLPNSSLVQVAGGQERFFWRMPVPGHDGHRVYDHVDPGDEAQAEVTSIQADDVSTEVIETERPFQKETLPLLHC
jgi:hypothetical protein